jgi:hypothetical protein
MDFNFTAGAPDGRSADLHDLNRRVFGAKWRVRAARATAPIREELARSAILILGAC